MVKPLKSLWFIFHLLHSLMHIRENSMQSFKDPIVFHHKTPPSFREDALFCIQPELDKGGEKELEKGGKTGAQRIL